MLIICYRTNNLVTIFHLNPNSGSQYDNYQLTLHLHRHFHETWPDADSPECTQPVHLQLFLPPRSLPTIAACTWYMYS